MESAVKMILICRFGSVQMSAHFQFASAIRAYEESRKRMYKSRLGLSPLRHMFLSFLYFVPQFLRDDRLVVIIGNHPIAHVFDLTLMIFVGNRCSLQHRQMSDVHDIVQHSPYTDCTPKPHFIRTTFMPVLFISMLAGRRYSFGVQYIRYIFRTCSRSVQFKYPTHYRRRFFVYDGGSFFIRAFEISIRRFFWRCKLPQAHWFA